MSITPLNITTAGDSGSFITTPAAQATPDPIVSTVAPAETSEAKRSTEAEVVNAVQALNGFASSMSVIDRDTDKVIRQIPSEEAVAISKSLDKLQGLLINDQA
jgi:flagellar protein FlaG